VVEQGHYGLVQTDRLTELKGLGIRSRGMAPLCERESAGPAKQSMDGTDADGPAARRDQRPMRKSGHGLDRGLRIGVLP
jgi:hypothetical protein